MKRGDGQKLSTQRARQTPNIAGDQVSGLSFYREMDQRLIVLVAQDSTKAVARAFPRVCKGMIWPPRKANSA